VNVASVLAVEAGLSLTAGLGKGQRVDPGHGEGPAARGVGGGPGRNFSAHLAAAQWPERFLLLQRACWLLPGAPARCRWRRRTYAATPGPPRRHRVLRPRPGDPRPGPATITRRLCTIAGFYRYAVEEDLLDHSPAAHVRRPRLDYESHATGLDRNELGALLVAAALGSSAEHALISLLALNGLRVSEATGASIEALGLERGHRTLVITRKGGKVVTIPLAPRTARAIDLAVSERVEGPIFLTSGGQRLDRHGAARIVRRAARRAGITKPVGPHTLRHAFITAALDAGVPLRDVQEAASHADPRTTIRYDRARGSLDRHATYIVAAYIAGAAR
jgi:integrase/recombinase XerD